MTVDGNQGGAPNYFPNSFKGPLEDKEAKIHPIQVTGDVRRYNSADEDNFTQCGIFFREVLKEDEKERLVDNIASHLCNAQKFLQDRAVKNFGSADKTFGHMLSKRLEFYNKAKDEPKSKV